LNDKSKTRALVFIVFLVISIPIFLTNNFIVELILVTLQLIYVGLTIYLRDTFHSDPSFRKTKENLDKLSKTPIEKTNIQTPFNGDYSDEGFALVDKNKKVEVSEPDINSYQNGKMVDVSVKTHEEYVKVISKRFNHDGNKDQEFKLVLERFLQVVKESLGVYSATFFVYNHQAKKIILKDYYPKTVDIYPIKFELGNDIVSKIVKEKSPKFLLNITQVVEADNIVYYKNPQGIKSFCGVPFEFDDGSIFILAVDSKNEDQFGNESIVNMGRFIHLIYYFIHMFNEYNNETNLEKKVTELSKMVSHTPSISNYENVKKYVGTSLKGLLNWNMITLSLVDQQTGLVKTVFIDSNKDTLKYIGENLELSTKSIAGTVLINKKEIYITDLSTEKRFRFREGEDIQLNGSFVAIPLVYENSIFGVVTYESLEKNNYTENEIEFAKSSTKILSFMLNVYFVIDYLKERTTLDYETLFLNKNEFARQVENAFARDKYSNIVGAIALIKVDSLHENSLFESSTLPVVSQVLTIMLKNSTKPLTLIGRIDSKLFAIYSFNSSSSEMLIWADQLRSNVATYDFPLESALKNQTISVGIASNINYVEFEQVYKIAELALEKAYTEGGNKVVRAN